MAAGSFVDLVDAQSWLDNLAGPLQGAVSSAYATGGEQGRALKNFLHGTWLGHPLHAVLTDVPVGAWTVAFVCDALDAITGREELAASADAAVGLGLAAALPTAASGLTDWQHVDGRSRRVGLAHGLLNLGATALYATSWLLRRNDAREAARGFAALGYAVMAASAYLGGDLVYEQRIGVSRVAGQSPPPDFVPVLPASELPDRALQGVEVGGMRVLLARHGTTVRALAETCSHLGGPLAEGRLQDDSVVCPWHGSRFSLETGRVLDGPATFPQPCLETRIRDGQIEVRTARPHNTSHDP
jgi:nitrite reductase/ring-hydroxylating ferredoxin subunit/uncharacterized membrane protein